MGWQNAIFGDLKAWQGWLGWQLNTPLEWIPQLLEDTVPTSINSQPGEVSSLHIVHEIIETCLKNLNRTLWTVVMLQYLDSLDDSLKYATTDWNDDGLFETAIFWATHSVHRGVFLFF